MYFLLHERKCVAAFDPSLDATGESPSSGEHSAVPGYPFADVDQTLSLLED